MKVVFVQALPFMLDSYLILSACLKEKGIKTEVFISAFEDNIPKAVVESNAQLVGFNTLTGSYQWALNVAKEIKEIKNIPVIFGGCHPTYYPEAVDFDTVDYICMGEGEQALVELCESLKNGTNTENIKNIAFKKNGELKINELNLLNKELDTLPFSDRALYGKYDFFKQARMYYYRTSRNCPYRCTFCCMDTLIQIYEHQQVFREYSVDYVLEELSIIKKGYKNLKTIMFTDEIFGIKKKRAKEILTRFQNEIELPYTLTTRANLLDDGFITLLKETGCQLVNISVETANEEIRTNILKKKIPNQLLISVGQKLYEAGIKTRVNCIFCLPDETLEDAFENVKLMKAMKVTDPVGFLLQPFPKTGIYDYAVENGYLENMLINDLDPLVFFKTPINIPDKKKIIIVQKLFKIACKVPHFDKLLRILVQIPDNFVNDIFLKIGIALSHKQFYNYNYWELIKYLLAARKLNVKSSI